MTTTVIEGNRFFNTGPNTPDARPVIEHIVTTLLRKGHHLATGCATGADALVVETCASLRQLHRLSIFAVFTPAGAGAFKNSNVEPVLAAFRHGADVHFSAGGDLYKPLRTRLAERTRVMIAWSFNAPGGSQLVAVFGPNGNSRGTALAVKTAALTYDRPVIALAVGKPLADLPLPGPGCWETTHEFLPHMARRWCNPPDAYRDNISLFA